MKPNNYLLNPTSVLSVALNPTPQINMSIAIVQAHPFKILILIHLHLCRTVLYNSIGMQKKIRTATNKGTAKSTLLLLKGI